MTADKIHYEGCGCPVEPDGEPPNDHLTWCGRDGHRWMYACNHLDTVRNNGRSSSSSSSTWQIIPVENPIKDGRVVTRNGESAVDAWKRYHTEVDAARNKARWCPDHRAYCNHEKTRYPSESWPRMSVDAVRWPGLLRATPRADHRRGVTRWLMRRLALGPDALFAFNLGMSALAAIVGIAALIYGLATGNGPTWQDGGWVILGAGVTLYVVGWLGDRAFDEDNAGSRVGRRRR